MADTPWFKSSYSQELINCVEVSWHKSSYSADTANCVEVSFDDRVLVRDSKDPEPILIFDRRSWQTFIRDLGASDD